MNAIRKIKELVRDLAHVGCWPAKRATVVIETAGDSPDTASLRVVVR